MRNLGLMMNIISVYIFLKMKRNWKISANLKLGLMLIASSAFVSVGFIHSAHLYGISLCTSKTFIGSWCAQRSRNFFMHVRVMQSQRL